MVRAGGLARAFARAGCCMGLAGARVVLTCCRGLACGSGSTCDANTPNPLPARKPPTGACHNLTLASPQTTWWHCKHTRQPPKLIGNANNLPASSLSELLTKFTDQQLS